MIFLLALFAQAEVSRFEITSMSCLMGVSKSGGLLKGSFVAADGAHAPDQVLLTELKACTDLWKTAEPLLKCGEPVVVDLVIDAVRKPPVAIGVKTIVSEARVCRSDGP